MLLMALAVSVARSNVGGGTERFIGELAAFQPGGGSSPTPQPASRPSGVLKIDVSDSAIPESLSEPTDPTTPVDALSLAIGDPLHLLIGDARNSRDALLLAR